MVDLLATLNRTLFSIMTLSIRTLGTMGFIATLKSEHLRHSALLYQHRVWLC
jgi:hypothetical protein